MSPEHSRVTADLDFGGSLSQAHSHAACVKCLVVGFVVVRVPGSWGVRFAVLVEDRRVECG